MDTSTHPAPAHRPLLLVTLVAMTALLAACGRPQPAPEPIRVVRSVVLAPGRAAQALEFAADIRARTESRVGFRVPGKMTSRQAEVGQRVKAGDVLARLDPSDLGLSQQAAQAAVRAAQVNHELAQADFKRFKDLRDQGFISGAELDRREATLKAAAAQLEQARAQAAVQGNQAAYSTLHAHAAGVVLAVEAEPGAVLAAGTPVVRLALDGPRDVVFAVPEDQLPLARALQGRKDAVTVQLWAGGGAFKATVREVAAAADAVTRTFQVKADLPASAAAQLGQTATVTIEQGQTDQALRLPLTAVREHQGGSAVWVVDASSGKVVLRPVKLGATQDQDVVVVDGLKPGERVVTAGVHVLTEGQAVRWQTGASAPGVASAASSATR